MSVNLDNDERHTAGDVRYVNNGLTVRGQADPLVKRLTLCGRIIKVSQWYADSLIAWKKKTITLKLRSRRDENISHIWQRQLFVSSIYLVVHSAYSHKATKKTMPLDRISKRTVQQKPNKIYQTIYENNTIEITYEKTPMRETASAFFHVFSIRNVDRSISKARSSGLTKKRKKTVMSLPGSCVVTDSPAQVAYPYRMRTSHKYGEREPRGFVISSRSLKSFQTRKKQWINREEK